MPPTCDGCHFSVTAGEMSDVGVTAILLPPKKRRLSCLTTKAKLQAGAGAKGKVLFRCCITWENGGLKDHLIFLLKPPVLIGIGRGGLPPTPSNYLAI